MVKNHIIVIFSLIIYVNCQNVQKCLTSNRESGVCQHYSRCPSAQKLYKTNRIQPTVCPNNNNRRDPIICCITNSNRKKPASSRPSPQQQVNQKITAPKERVSDKKCDDEYTPIRTDFGISVAGGIPAKPGEYPYMATLGWRDSTGGVVYNCGGVLISKNFVLTAAHCTSMGGSAPRWVLIGGNALVNNTNINIPIQRIIIYANYRPQQSYHDLALLKLSRPSDIKPICLWTDNNDFNEVTAIGYGSTSFAGPKSQQLLKVTLSVFSNDDCRKSYPADSQLQYGLIDSQMCAGKPGEGKDTCQGDSGGPLIRKKIKNTLIPYVVGITSFGQICALDTASIYTRVSSYLNWIESEVWPNG